MKDKKGKLVAPNCVERCYYIICPIVMYILLSIICGLGLYSNPNQYLGRICCSFAVMFIIWIGVLFAIRKNTSGKLNYKELIIYIFLFSGLAFYFACSVWGNGALSLNPIERVNRGIQHQDELYHSMIAEAYKQHFPVKLLVNEGGVLRYHTLSHLLISQISRITALPAFIVYNYLYPVIFIPIYVYAQLFAISKSKYYFSGTEKLQMMDIVCIVLFNLGMLPKKYSFACGIFVTNYFASESFLVANTLLLFFLGIFFVIAGKQKKEKQHRIFLLVVIPLFIFLISWAKISSGFLAAIFVIYYFFRSEMKNIIYWIYNIYYGCIFLVSLFLFNGLGLNNASADPTWGRSLFAYKSYCADTKCYVGHFVLLGIWALGFLICEIINGKLNIQSIKSKDTIWMEEVSIVTIISFMPCVLLYMAAGNASYFSHIAPIFGITFFLGQNYWAKLSNHITKKWSCLIGILYCAILIIINSPINSFIKDCSLSDNNMEKGIYEQSQDIKNIVSGREDEYTIFIDKDAEVTRLSSNDLTQVFLYPGLTGISVINASYLLNGRYYTFTDQRTQGYGLDNTKQKKMSFEEAKKEAELRGKKHIIHMKRYGIEIIDLQNEGVIHVGELK